MMNGSTKYRPCARCGEPCSLSMIGKLAEWLCWDCTREAKP